MSPRGPSPDPTETQRYAFERVLGRGGSGWVALATDTRLGRQVAVKTVYGGTLDQEAVARLRREARVLAAAGHPHVAKVFQLLSDGPDVHVVMEYAPGGDLGSALREGRLPGSAVARVLADVAEALELAAARDIVHRDVKPGNVLLTADSRGKLADFGLARLPRASGAFRTADGSVSGTPAYMAPEQFTDPDADVPQVDWFSYAVMACEALTGSLPFSSRGWLPAEVAPSASAVAGLPVPVGTALLAALDPDPTLRPAPRAIADAILTTAPEVWDELVPPRPTATAAPVLGDQTVSGPGGTDEGHASLGFPFLPSDPDPDEPSLTTPATVVPPVFVPTRSRRARVPLVIGVLVGGVVGIVVALLVR